MNRVASHFRIENAESPWRLHCWGDLAVTTLDGQDFTPRSRKARALLAWLALHPDRPVSRERLAGLLWGDRAEEQARASLRQTLFELRPFSEGLFPLISVSRAAVTLHGTRLVTDLAGQSPRPNSHEDEPLFANLDDIDESFDNWLRSTRAHEHQQNEDRSKALLAPKFSEPQIQTPQTFVAVAPATFAAVVPAMAAIIAIVAIIVTLYLAMPLRRNAGTQPTTIAVLPFQSGPGAEDPAFAVALADDVRLYLARNPQAEVIGHFSTTVPTLAKLTPRAAGRLIGVGYVVTGRVATNGGGTRAEASLVRTADGITVWSGDFAAAPASLFVSQQAIGTAIERQLGLDGNADSKKQPRGDVYALVLAARELAFAQEPAKMAAAEAILRRAVAMDANDARANAALARAIFWRARLLSGVGAAQSRDRQEGIAHARIALSLAPDLSDSHLAMAEAVATLAEPDAGLANLEAAARLDPGRAEIWLDIANTNTRLGNYTGAMNALRQAVRVEPYWWLAVYQASELAWNLGHQRESMAIANRFIGQGDPYVTNSVKGDIAWRKGDFSGEVAYNNVALGLASEGERTFAQMGLSRSSRAARLYERARANWVWYPVTEEVFSGWQGIAPTPRQFAAETAIPADFWARNATRQTILRNMVNVGRTAELVNFLDRSGNDPKTVRNQHLTPTSFLDTVPPLVLALRAQGRSHQADALLDAGRAEMQPLISAPEVLNSLFAIDAQLLMLEGHTDQALSRLEQARARGWLYTKQFLLPDMADEPAFKMLRGNPRFERVRAAENAIVSRERREIIAQSADPRTN